MEKEILTYGDIEIQIKKKNFLFLPPEDFILLKDVDIEKVLVSNKISFNEKS